MRLGRGGHFKTHSFVERRDDTPPRGNSSAAFLLRHLDAARIPTSPQLVFICNPKIPGHKKGAREYFTRLIRSLVSAYPEMLHQESDAF